MSEPLDTLHSAFDRAFASMSQTRERFAPELVPREIGAITEVSTGIAKASGLPSVGFETQACRC
jgi:F-type H+-transporting ATPase subunit alpha